LARGGERAGENEGNNHHIGQTQDYLVSQRGCGKTQGNGHGVKTGCGAGMSVKVTVGWTEKNQCRAGKPHAANGF